MLLFAIQIPQMLHPFRPCMAHSHISILFNCTLHVSIMIIDVPAGVGAPPVNTQLHYIQGHSFVVVATKRDLDALVSTST